MFCLSWEFFFFREILVGEDVEIGDRLSIDTRDRDVRNGKGLVVYSPSFVIHWQPQVEESESYYVNAK